MAVHGLLTGLMNSIGSAKRKLAGHPNGDVYHALHQCEGILNGALNRYWRRARTRTRAKTKRKTSKGKSE